MEGSVAERPQPQVFEKGDHIYIVAPVSPFTPGDAEISEFAFAEELKKLAPNDALMWLRGQYVEADNPNANGQTWTAGELQIKSMTPMFMPVTVMHDERTAVGLIADTALKVPEKDSVPRARIDTSLALWQHRFPDVCEEAKVNYEAGSLMQSMECISPDYSCRECGQVFQKLPGGAERTNWCSHLAEASGLGARILGNVVFTGTGLIFGTRGARGAYDEAHLEVFQDEVAEFHEKAHRDKSTKKKTTPTNTPSTSEPRRKVKNVETVEISKSEYDALKADKAKLEERDAALKTAEDEKAQAIKDSEAAEAAKVEAEKKLADEEKKVKDFEEANQKDEMASDRLEKLGKGFTGKLGEKTSERVKEQARTLSDEDWESRLVELEEMTEVSRDTKGENEDGSEDEGKDGKNGEGKEFSRTEVANSQVGGGGGGGSPTTPGPAERSSVVAGLMPSLNGDGDGKKSE